MNPILGYLRLELAGFWESRISRDGIIDSFIHKRVNKNINMTINMTKGDSIIEDGWIGCFRLGISTVPKLINVSQIEYYAKYE